jgi:hypothetical protein
VINLFVPNKKNEYKPILLSNVALCIYTLCLFFVNTFGGLIGISDVHASTITSANIIKLANTERVKYGLNELKTNAKLNAAALAKGNNMLSVGYWNHFGPNGETPWQFIKSAGYTYVYAGENLAKGFKSAEGVHEAWMASPTHRENLLSGNYLEIGVAVINGNLLGEDVVLVVQMFGNQTNMTVLTPKPNVPVVQTETGDTSSIKITAPLENSIINDAGVDIKGTTSNIDNSYTVEITDKSLPVGAFETNSDKWSWDKKSDWSDGSHTVGVKVKGKTSINDKVTFTVDTNAPNVADFQAIVNTDGWEISGKLDDPKGSLSLVSGEYIHTVKIESDGKFVAQIKSSVINDKVVLITADTVGNSLTTDVSDKFENKEGKVLSGFSTILNTISNKDTLNTLFIGFIFVLLLIEVVTYWRRGLLAKHGGNLFTLGFWWLLALVGVISGFSGGIK